jgi:hypothetical protein
LEDEEEREEVVDLADEGRDIMVDVRPDFSVLGVIDRDEVSVRVLLSRGMIAFSGSEGCVAAAVGLEISTATFGAISKL